MNLTEDQIQHEAGLIGDETNWPWWPILPMKLLGRSTEDKSTGIMWARHKNRVYLIGLTDIKAGDFAEQVKDVEVVEAENTVELVRMGWVGD